MMKLTAEILSQVLYTSTHEWILFDGTLAYAGLTLPKLIPLKNIETIDYDMVTKIFKRGESIASLKGEQNVLEVLMPVEGIILDHNLQLKPSEFFPTDGFHLPWMFFLAATKPNQKSELITCANYQKIIGHDI